MGQRRFGAMAKYYFDVRDNDVVYPDEDGMEQSSLANVRAEAIQTLAEYVRSTLRDETRHTLRVDVHDEDSRPVLHAVMVFEVEISGPAASGYSQ
ncbi:hypothetical protein MAXJ12_31939 [Mesorhizobium alhagi CCNWXJ12-2]|uniref:DUF6894 domain-containing protein n=2 Tax=Allomesorhizobium alhagi TaxID=475067 RepID=H0I1Q0_9HYPH|nr:hypothetical protein MAXJ12_31939 [Mesorhizobium alhagi CCNWXJ12-2]